MYRKIDNTLQAAGNKKGRPQDNHRHIQLNNKENINKGVRQQQNSGQKITNMESNFGSTVVSPTFQSHNLLNKQEDLFKQQKHKGYTEVSLSLKDITLQDHNLQHEIVQAGLKEDRSVEDQKLRLIQHYQNKSYWQKIEKLFQQDNVDAVLAWEDSISKYKVIKKKSKETEHQNNDLRDKVKLMAEAIQGLERQIALDRNQTRVLSQKKCKNCESLEQKQKQYHELYQESKRMSKELKERGQQLSTIGKNFIKMQEKYLQQRSLKQQMQKRRTILKQELERKSSRLLQKQRNEKQLQAQLLKLQGEERVTRKLHIQCEQLKEFKYQTEKSVTKMEEKFKKQIQELSQQCKELVQEKGIYGEENGKLKAELTDLRPSLLKSQLQLQRVREEAILRGSECEELKRKLTEIIGEERVRRADYEEKLSKARGMFQESQEVRNKLDFELTHEKKISEDKDEVVNKYIEVIRQLQGKIRQCDSHDSRGREGNYFNLAKTKNPNSNHSSSSHNHSTNNPSPKLYYKIKEIYDEIKNIAEESVQSVARRRFRQEESEQREVTGYQFERFINEIHSDLSNFINKYYYVHKDNDILKQKLQIIEEEKEGQCRQVRKELGLKEHMLRAILSFMPDDLKDGVVDLLQVVETLISNDSPEESELQDFDEMRFNVESEGKEWRETYHRMKFKFRKMEDDIRRLGEENEEFKRRGRGKEIKKTLPTDYDYDRERKQKEIHRKYF